MKDVATPASQSEVRGTIKEALTKAALVNYERLSEEARIEGTLYVRALIIDVFFNGAKVYYVIINCDI